MIVDCPNCKNSLRVKKQDKEHICYKCGTIITEERIVQVGMVKYKFKDDKQEFVIVFNSVEEKEDFLETIKKEPDQYQYCRMTTPAVTVEVI